MRTTADEPEELILADGVAYTDPTQPCFVEGCGKPMEIPMGPDEDLGFCSGHAAALVLQALEIIEVQEALAKQGKAVLVLDGPQLRALRALQALLHSSAPLTTNLEGRRRYLILWTEGREMAIYGPEIPDPSVI